MYETQYVAPPPYQVNFDYRTPPISPAHVSTHTYFSPRFSSYTSSPQSRPSARPHTRRATQDATFAYTSTPSRPSYFTAYTSPAGTTPKYTASQRKPDYVSGSDPTRSSSRRCRAPAYDSGGRPSDRRYTAQSYNFHTDVFVDYDEEEYLPAYDRKYRHSPPPPPYRQSYRDHDADRCAYFDQIPIYTPANEPAAYQSRPRRSSHATKPQRSPPKPRPTPPKARPRQATEEDARRADIPAGYSYKHWDPSEEPILLLGSVFDANSLGKWIYDWTVAFHGPSTPMSDIAGDLWLLLIQLAGKVKRAEDTMSSIRRTENRELIDDFLDSGERLWQRFNKLLKICEASMLKAAKKEGSKKLVMGKSSGCEFVDCIFGRDRELARTEQLMTGIRLWGMRFDANCDEVLRNPSA